MPHIAVENRPSFLRLHMPPDPLKEGNPGRLELCPLDLLRIDETFQKANKSLHALLGLTPVFRGTDHQAKEMCKGLFIRYALNQLIEKQPSGHPPYMEHPPATMSSLLK